MRYFIPLFFVLLIIYGCKPVNPKQDERTLVRINNYEISLNEFEDEFKVSQLGKIDTLESRKEFIDNLINRKLILQESEKLELKEDRSFLKNIERFWEQTLLTAAIDRKTKEIQPLIRVDDDEIEKYYNSKLKEGKTTKTIKDLYQEIRAEIIKQKELQLINEWVLELRKKAKIDINYQILAKQ